MEPSSWTEIGVFFTTALAAIVAAGATAINFWLYRSHVSPEVVVYVTGDERRPSIIILVIENIGKGVAKNVRFELSAPIPMHAFGLKNPPPARVMNAGPLISGIPSLGPGARRVITWGQYPALSKFLGDRVIRLVARYTADQRTPWDPDEITTESFLDVKSLEMTDTSDRNYDKMAAEQLKTIAGALEKLSLGWRKLRIEVDTSPPLPDEEAEDDTNRDLAAT